MQQVPQLLQKLTLSPKQKLVPFGKQSRLARSSTPRSWKPTYAFEPGCGSCHLLSKNVASSWITPRAASGWAPGSAEALSVAASREQQIRKAAAGQRRGTGDMANACHDASPARTEKRRRGETPIRDQRLGTKTADECGLPLIRDPWAHRSTAGQRRQSGDQETCGLHLGPNMETTAPRGGMAWYNTWQAGLKTQPPCP